MKKAKQLIDGPYFRYFNANKLDVVTIGKKATEYFKKNGIDVSASYDDVWDNLDYDHASTIAQQFMNDFTAKKYDKIELIYNHMKNAASQEVIQEQYLPVEPPTEEELDDMDSIPDYIFEPDKQTIVEGLIPKSLKIQLYTALLDSNAGEHGSRMTAMHKATDNAGEMLKDLTLMYNKARQAAITNEILEIVGGAEALKG